MGAFVDVPERFVKFLDYDARHRPKTSLHCVRCQKDIRGSYRMVHVIWGGSHVLHPSYEPSYVPDAGDMGLHPIGPDCARKLGSEWSVKESAI